jgi:hypothetical protein
MAGASLGSNAKLYRQTTGTRATWGAVGSDGYTHEGAAAGSLDEVPNCKDVSIPLEDDKAETSTRGNNGFKSYLNGLTDAPITITMVYDKTDADMLAFLKAKMMKTPIALAILDGDKATVGTLGLWADFQVFKFEKQEPLDGAQMVQIEVAPAYSSVGPEWVKVTS